MENLILTGAGIVVGAFVTSAVAECYYEKASKDLMKEAEKLRKLNILMLKAMEQAGLAEFTRDNEGNVKKIDILLKSHAEGNSQPTDDTELKE